MARLTAVLLLASLASANYTTIVWMTKVGKSDKYGYVASVISAEATQIAMSLEYDNSTDLDALNLGGQEGNFTFGPSVFTVNQDLTRYSPEPTADMETRLECTRPANPTDAVSCTNIIGGGMARLAYCNEYQITRTRQHVRPNTTTTYQHTYGTGLWGSSGTETITWTIAMPEQTATTTPAWCTSDDVPGSVRTIPYTTDAGEFAYYVVVVTAGEEKLSAYSGSPVTLPLSTPSPARNTATTTAGSSASPGTGTTGNELPQSTGAAGKKKVILPALAGVGLVAIMGLA